MLGAAVGLIKSGVFKELDGKVDFIATPAEEFIELAYRSKLKLTDISNILVENKNLSEKEPLTM